MTVMTRDEVERGYNNRAAVPDHPRWFARIRRVVSRGGS